MLILEKMLLSEENIHAMLEECLSLKTQLLKTKLQTLFIELKPPNFKLLDSMYTLHGIHVTFRPLTLAMYIKQSLQSICQNLDFIERREYSKIALEVYFDSRLAKSR